MRSDGWCFVGRNGMATASAMAPFVWGEVSFDAGESPEHIVVRKEAERIAGSGEFWWGVDTPLGISVEVKAEQNGGTLPVLFSRSRKTGKQQSSQVRVWDTWRSLLHPQQHGRIPGHIIVTSGHNPGKRQTRYALTCHSDVKLALGAIGFCDLAQCRSVKGGGRSKAADNDNAIPSTSFAPLGVRSSTTGTDHSGIFTLWRIMVLANFRILMGFPSKEP